MDTVLVVGRMEGVLVEYFIATMYRVVVGMLAGAILGVICGIAMSWNRWINSILDPLIEALRPIPAVALIPFFILWFGIGDTGKLILTALGGFTVMVVTTLEAIKHVSPIYIMAARTLGANRLTIYRTVILPAITPPLIGRHESDGCPLVRFGHRGRIHGGAKWARLHDYARPAHAADRRHFGGGHHHRHHIVDCGPHGTRDWQLSDALGATL